MTATPDTPCPNNSPAGIVVSDACSGIERAITAARRWCAENPGWEPICDMESTDHLYVRWKDLSKKAKASWRYHFGSSAEAAFAEDTHPCKVAHGWVDENGVFTEDVPFNVVGMSVYHTQNNPLSRSPR